MVLLSQWERPPTKEEKMSNEYTPQHISPEQLENVIAILNDQKKKEESETCLICFQDYLTKNTKDHQCPDTFCGACGEQYDPTTEQDENGFHLSEICGANDEETWANLPTTCPDFVSHPHIVEQKIYTMDGEYKETRKGGCYTCQTALASEEQGTTALMSALLDLSIPCDVHQTGGFTMCVYIKTGDESYVYANAEGFAFYKDENCDGWANYYFAESENTPQAKAKAIAQTMKTANLEAKELG